MLHSLEYGFTMMETPSFYFMQIFINKDVFIAQNLFIPYCQLRSLFVKLQNPAAWFFFFLIHIRWKTSKASETANIWMDIIFQIYFLNECQVQIIWGNDNSSKLATPHFNIV